MAFDIFKAMDKLGVKRVPFDYAGQGSARGYSIGNEVAVRPSEDFPEFVAIHEMAHVLLGHTLRKPESDEELIARLPELLQKMANEDISEVEAHSVAIFTCSLAGIHFDFEREAAYVAHHLERMENIDNEAIGERVADMSLKILEAGM